LGGATVKKIIKHPGRGPIAAGERLPCATPGTTGGGDIIWGFETFFLNGEMWRMNSDDHRESINPSIHQSNQ
jgi:hypothetical protein